MRSVFATPIGIYGAGSITLQVPQGALLLGVDIVYGGPALVLMGNPQAAPEPLTVHVSGIGSILPEGIPLTYLGKAVPPGLPPESGYHVFAEAISIHR